MEATTQCEGCNGEVEISEANFESYPGATLAFCDDCYGPTRAEELGVRR